MVPKTDRATAICVRCLINNNARNRSIVSAVVCDVHRKARANTVGRPLLSS